MRNRGAYWWKQEQLMFEMLDVGSVAHLMIADFLLGNLTE